MKTPRLLPGLLAALAIPTGFAGEPPIPEPPLEADFEALRKTSPFTRVLSLPETYALRGVATIDGQRVATLYNRQTKQTLVVTPEGGNEVGLSLVEVTPAPQLDGVVAKISFAGDEAELRYDVSQINPEPKAGPGGSGRQGGERRGPSPQDVERFRNLPEDKQAKLREYIGRVMQSYPNMSREERGNLIRGAMVRLMDGREIEMPPAPADGQSNPRRNSGENQSQNQNRNARNNNGKGRGGNSERRR